MAAEDFNYELLDPRRAVPASIRGHLYQAAVGVWRWLALEKGEVLVCEGDEDLDRHRGDCVTSEQVKDLGRNVSIRDLCDTVRGFLLTYVMLRRQSLVRRFVFSCTARKAKQRIDDVGVDVLDAWAAPERQDEVAAALRKLLPVEKPKERAEAIANAISWLDAETGRWAGFLKSVQWRFGEPNFEGIRAEIGKRLSSEKAAVKLPRDLLSDRLIAEVLTASSRSNIGERILDRRALADIFATTTAELRAWEESAEGALLCAVVQEALVLGRLLDDGMGTLEADPAPGKLLTAAFEVIPFNEEGRRQELALLERFCDDDERCAVLLFKGEGGVGKTRLMIEWCRRLGAKQWHAGFLRRHARLPEPHLLLEGTTPRLVVVDYAETRLDDIVKPLLEVLVRASGSARLRLVLLARRSVDPAARLPHTADWWEALKHAGDEIEGLLSKWKPQVIGELVAGIEAREKAFNMALQRFANILGRSPEALPASRLDDASFDRALYLHMAALDVVLSDDLARGDPLARTLRHERRFWGREIDRIGLDAHAREVLKEAVDPVMAIVTLLGGSDISAAAGIAQAVGGDLSSQDLRRLSRLLRRLYGEPSAGHDVGPLTPDLLGEQLVTEQLDHNRGLVVTAFDFGDESARANVLNTVSRIAQREPQALAWLKLLLSKHQESVASLAHKVAVVIGNPIYRKLAQQIGGDDEASREFPKPPEPAELTIRIPWSALRDSYSGPDVVLPTHQLPFARLSLIDFGRLCLWLVRREGYERAEYLDAVSGGSDLGRDIIAWRRGRQVVFRCRRVDRMDPKGAEKEIEKLRSLPPDDQPDDVVFVVSTNVGVKARDRARASWGDQGSCDFWAGTELDERVKRYADILHEFFDLGPEGLRTLEPAVADEPPRYYSTYISYSRTDADRAFALKLYERLKAEGVSCWLYDHDMNPGEVELDTADRAIREAEKLLLCCSETSLESWWVHDELDKAIQKERDLWRDRRLILIPLKLDDHLYNWESGKASIVRSRHPADFEGWQEDPQKFDGQLRRVLRALKVEGAPKAPPSPRL